jgi:hypothetical protein
MRDPYLDGEEVLRRRNTGRVVRGIAPLFDSGVLKLHTFAIRFLEIK